MLFQVWPWWARCLAIRLRLADNQDFKFTNFANKNQDRPDTISNVVPRLDGSVGLNVNALDTQGQFTVPLITSTNPLAASLVAQYGYLASGVRTGGGVVGGYNQFNNQDFFRKNYQLSYDATFGASVTHEVHVGYQTATEAEELLRVSNGWGSITAQPSTVVVPAGLPNAGQQVIFQAQVFQQGILHVPTIRSEYVQQNIEFNDKVRWNKYTLNVGLIVSNDKLYGQGLRANASTPSGWELANGQRYLEQEIKFADTLQPRLGLTYNYRAEDTVYGNYARYVPAATSIPRGASWARNKIQTINAYFNATGTLLATAPEVSSSGKLFQAGMKPRHTDEFLVGTTKDFGKGWSARLHARYRYSCNFWEDTPNNSRIVLNPPDGIPRDYYIPNLGPMLTALGYVPSNSTLPARAENQYVIAQLDRSFTKYYETGLETEWHGTNAYLRASYVWSHYYGNFDQDNTTAGAGNDANLFIGSSNIADDFGRQVWNNKYGNLSGDRRHQVKLYGYYAFSWKGRMGAYAIYQSGQPWQYSNYKIYAVDAASQGSTSTSDTNRYAEPAGSRTTRPHYQLDLNYTQTFWQLKTTSLEAAVDLYNTFNRQTGYNPATSINGTAAALLGQPTSFYSPRRMQASVRLLF